ncbi:MAG: HepT-like ribonuclease domain-containing protein [Verrucomicrobiota bacterium]
MTTEAKKRLHDIRMAAEALCRFTDGKVVEDFKRDELLQAAVERKLAIIGEAFVHLREEDADIAEQFSNVRQIVGMRNRLVHGYDQLDLDVVWDATVNHVPRLLKQAEAMLE